MKNYLKNWMPVYHHFPNSILFSFFKQHISLLLKWCINYCLNNHEILSLPYSPLLNLVSILIMVHNHKIIPFHPAACFPYIFHSFFETKFCHNFLAPWGNLNTITSANKHTYMCVYTHAHKNIFYYTSVQF